MVPLPPIKQGTPHSVTCEGPGQVSSHGFSGPREIIRLRKEPTRGTLAHTGIPPKHSLHDETKMLTLSND